MQDQLNSADGCPGLFNFSSRTHIIVPTVQQPKNNFTDCRVLMLQFAKYALLKCNLLSDDCGLIRRMTTLEILQRRI